MPAQSFAGMAEASSKRIIILDDERNVTDLISYHLKANGYTVEAVNDPTSFLERARAHRPHLAILDLVMPHMSGLEVWRMLRSDPKLKDLQVIFLTARKDFGVPARDSDPTRDQVVIKSLGINRLSKAVDTAFLRVAPAEGDDLIAVGPMVIDLRGSRVTINLQAADLTSTEFRLLRVLAASKGRIISRARLLQELQADHPEMEARTIDTHFRRLRKKLGSAASLIETIRGAGYRLADSPETAAPPVS
jgi:two-component system, OmpR family, phosphate regulon response regulator PhoB